VPPVQRPYPPVWYPTAHAENIAWAARHRLNFLDAFVSSFASSGEGEPSLVARYEQEYASRHSPVNPINAHVAEPRRGFIRHIVIADTVSEAEAIARPAYERYVEHFNQLWLERGGFAPLRMDYREFTARGYLLAGNPVSIGQDLAAVLGRVGGNYIVGVFAFGDLATTHVLRSMERFAHEVIPHVVALPRVAVS
jgi:alkanesulfonate monooxygenase SsuD/methylene tetrahydromethanopterin reductase-like flavin-dependent oxidoreductase (luciferase family)